MSTETRQSSIRPEKVATIEQITGQLENSRLVVLSDYRGMTANEMTEFRKELGKSGVSANIYKNTLARRAFNDLNIEFPADLLQGPTIMISTDTDAVEASKTVVKFSKSNEALKIKGGVLQNAHVDESTINELAKLPGRDELVAKAVGLIKAPLTGLVANLSSPVRGLGNVLTAIQNKKDGGE